MMVLCSSPSASRASAGSMAHGLCEKSSKRAGSRPTKRAASFSRSSGSGIAVGVGSTMLPRAFCWDCRYSTRSRSRSNPALLPASSRGLAWRRFASSFDSSYASSPVFPWAFSCVLSSAFLRAFCFLSSAPFSGSGRAAATSPERETVLRNALSRYDECLSGALDAKLVSERDESIEFLRRYARAQLAPVGSEPVQ